VVLEMVDAYTSERTGRFAALCEMHEIDPKVMIGGAYVSWHVTMQG
jgi:hypothetical protein